MIIEKQNLFKKGNIRLVKPREEENGVIVRRGVLISQNGAFLVHYTDDLQTLYKMLDCRVIDIITRDICKKPFDLIVDDEGLMKDDNFLTALCSKNGKPLETLYGNILICGLADENGDLTDISGMDLERIVTQLAKAPKSKYLKTSLYLLGYEIYDLCLGRLFTS